MITIKEKSYAEITRLYGKKEPPICEVMKNKETIRASFSVAPHTANVIAIARDKVLTLNLLAPTTVGARINR